MNRIEHGYPDVEKSFESAYVQGFYSRFSKEFSATRRIPWPMTAKFLAGEENSLIIDCGSGNGRSSSFNTVCVDTSRELLAYCNRSIGRIRADVNGLPFKDSTFDSALSVAVIHHMCTKDRRLNSLKEMSRVVKKNGKILVVVWGAEARMKKKARQTADIYENTNFTDNDRLVTWNNNPESYRYYHFFEEAELSDLIKEAGMSVLEIGKENESIHVVALNRA